MLLNPHCGAVGVPFMYTSTGCAAMSCGETHGGCCAKNGAAVRVQRTLAMKSRTVLAAPLDTCAVHARARLNHAVALLSH